MNEEVGLNSGSNSGVPAEGPDRSRAGAVKSKLNKDDMCIRLQPDAGGTRLKGEESRAVGGGGLKKRRMGKIIARQHTMTPTQAGKRDLEANVDDRIRERKASMGLGWIMVIVVGRGRQRASDPSWNTSSPVRAPDHPVAYARFCPLAPSLSLSSSRLTTLSPHLYIPNALHTRSYSQHAALVTSAADAAPHAQDPTATRSELRTMSHET
ncbi:hypothetical protein BDN70DRAFT_965990 [Pholiota conissans]|uniref:Uncharacterized protein n=1 Tax=Pholiota conissans TaxID=109636 RepID=A0A9P5YRC1_9AGAR|nr:hypothetical protein BDN70DRAFT_965990 [Pholiota conissans]